MPSHHLRPTSRCTAPTQHDAGLPDAWLQQWAGGLWPRRASSVPDARPRHRGRTLDVQYFLWDSYATGRRLADRLLRAADRGVRVRVLVDDVNMKGRDEALATLDAHPNVEIRLFNPFANRSSHLLGFLTDFDRVNHRMHNKLMVMDNAVAIVGGGNMADTYFEVDPTSSHWCPPGPGSRPCAAGP